MKQSLYAKYVAEKYGHETIETETCLLVYQLCGVTCNIELLYTDRDARMMGHAKELVELLVSKLPEKIECLSCTIDTTGNGAMDSFAAISNYGFKPLSTRGQHIVMVKYLKEGDR